ncbi:MAG: leucine-rich repeat domain-containing protein [Clostridia bacterium]|nr:leucine-rich repeat domain-containing protein [Clostridia bacterium]
MKRIATVFMCLVLLLSVLPLGALSVSAASSGTTGDCKWSLSGTTLTISGKGKMGDYNVAEEQYAPWGNAITSVTIKDGVTSVGMGAFYLCSTLTKVSLPDSLREIRELAFCGCIKLKKLTIPDSVTTIGGGAFSVCRAMEYITIPDSVTTIGDMAFYSSALTEITIPNSVTYLGVLALAECYSFNHAIIGSGVTRLSEGLFDNNDSFRRVTFTDKVTVIAEDAFSGCPGLDDVYYTGNAEQKAAITIETGNYAITDEAQWHTEIEPMILTQPKTAYAPKGSMASVTVGAIGYGLKYVWWIKNVGDSKYEKTDVTGDTYSVKMDNTAKNRYVMCYVYDGNGNRLQAKTVRLRESISVTAHPKNGYAPMGKTVSVKVGISGDGVRYEWWYQDAGSSKYVKSSVTSATYTATMSAKSKNRRVLCKAYDQYGNMVKTESAALRESVSVVTQPKTGYAQLGKSARVTVKAAGDGLKYTWYIKNAGATRYSKSSVTSATYSVKMTENVHGRRVYSVVTDKYGKTVQTNTVLLRRAASIVTQPKTVTVAKNKTAKVTVKAAGDGLKYTWYIKNAGQKKYSKSSVTKSTYSCKMTSKVNGRYVYCVVTDKYGKTVKTSTVRVKMK